MSAMTSSCSARTAAPATRTSAASAPWASRACCASSPGVRWTKRTVTVLPVPAAAWPPWPWGCSPCSCQAGWTSEAAQGAQPGHVTPGTWGHRGDGWPSPPPPPPSFTLGLAQRSFGPLFQAERYAGSPALTPARGASAVSQPCVPARCLSAVTRGPQQPVRDTAHSDSVLLRTERPGAAGVLGKQCRNPRDGFFYYYFLYFGIGWGVGFYFPSAWRPVVEEPVMTTAEPQHRAGRGQEGGERGLWSIPAA